MDLRYQKRHMVVCVEWMILSSSRVAPQEDLIFLSQQYSLDTVGIFSFLNASKKRMEVRENDQGSNRENRQQGGSHL